MKKKQLIDIITTAFKDVQLEDGIGLREANGLDDYEPDERLAELRKLDEKIDWQQIPFDDFYTFDCAFSYFDAKGMRFHLPQYLIADILAKELQSPPEWRLEGWEMFNEQFKLFNIEQVQAVIYYLEYTINKETSEQFKTNRACGIVEEYRDLLQANMHNSQALQLWEDLLIR